MMDKKRQELLEKTMIEKTFLGSAFALRMDPLEEMGQMVSPSQLLLPEYQVIYMAMLALQAVGRKPDTVVLADYLREQGELSAAGGAEMIKSIAHCIYPETAQNWRDYAKTIVDRANRRNAKAYLLQKSEEAMDLSQDLDTVLASVNTSNLALGGKIKPRLMDDALNDWLASLGQEHGGVKSGIRDLDRLIGKFYAGDLVLVIARPSMGKTAVLQHFMVSAAKQGKHTLFFSLEMNESQLLTRLVAYQAEMDSNAFRAEGPAMTQDVREKAKKAVAQLDYVKQSSVIITRQQGDVGLSDIVRYIRFYRQYWGSLDAIYIDYIDFLREAIVARMKGTPLNDIGGAISKRLKAIADREKVAVILCSQLNRDLEKRQDKHPILADIRNCGELEQDADVVISLYRDEYYNKPDSDTPSTKPGILELEVLKQRNGRTGCVMTHFNGAQCRIDDVNSDAVQAILDDEKRRKEQAKAAKQRDEATHGMPLLSTDGNPLDDLDIPF